MGNGFLHAPLRVNEGDSSAELRRESFKTRNTGFGNKSQGHILQSKPKISPVPPLTLPPELFSVAWAGPHLLYEWRYPGEGAISKSLPTLNLSIYQPVYRLHEPVVTRRDVDTTQGSRNACARSSS